MTTKSQEPVAGPGSPDSAIAEAVGDQEEEGVSRPDRCTIPVSWGLWSRRAAQGGGFGHLLISPTSDQIRLSLHHQPTVAFQVPEKVCIGVVTERAEF